MSHGYCHEAPDGTCVVVGRATISHVGLGAHRDQILLNLKLSPDEADALAGALQRSAANIRGTSHLCPTCQAPICCPKCECADIEVEVGRCMHCGFDVGAA